MSTAFFKPIRFDWLRSTTRTPWTDPTYSWFTAWISSLTAAQRRTTDVQYLAEVGEKVNLPRLERLAAHVRQVRPNVVVRFHRRQRTEFEPMVFHEPLYATPLVSVGPPAYET
ncbi:hypothetical protein BGZ73_008291 [Actinomortierella ambigua]|nr:hypothetical protein BGZ73_008291 [Actinomortierella ambigua]